MESAGTHTEFLFLLTTDPHLGPNDLGSVLEGLVDVSEKWFYIGLCLKLKPGILNGIKANQSNILDRMCEMLQEWLKNSTSPPTWKALVAALRSKKVGENQLANELEQKHCSEVTEAGIVASNIKDTSVMSTVIG